MSFPLKHSSYRWNIPPSGGVPLRYDSEAARKAEKEWVGVFTVSADTLQSSLMYSLHT